MTTPCPCETCESVYECDACLDLHLRRDHGTNYVAAYGSVPQAWVGLCARHTSVPAQRFGGVEQDPVAPL